jgi:hypothetical protein
MNAPIIGLIGRARSGKDTFAARLVAEHGYTRLAFADALKDMALEVDPVVDYDWRSGDARHLSEFVRLYGWEHAKDGPPEVRRFLQNLGVAVRNADPDFWVSRVREQLPHFSDPASQRPIVVTDVRFRNEADMIREADGILVRITRPGQAEDSHVSETELAYHRCDHVVANDRTLADLHTLADHMAEHALHCTLASA